MSELSNYECGNIKFKLCDYDNALQYYSLGIIECADVDLRIKLLLNRSMCNLKLRLYDDAISDCTEVLRLDPSNCKALLRRSMAYEYTGDFERGLTDLYLLKSLPEVPTSFRISASQLTDRLEKLCKLDNDLMFDQHAESVFISTNSEQCLRLNLQDIILDNALNLKNITNALDFRICIGNEFGLWNQLNLYCNCCKINYCSVHSVYVQSELILLCSNTVINPLEDKLSISVLNSTNILNVHGKVYYIVTVLCIMMAAIIVVLYIGCAENPI